MVEYPPHARRLIAALRSLPSIGARTAERLAIHILNTDATAALNLSEAIREARHAIRPCRQCGFFAEEELCEICRDTTRERSLICVVEESTDVLTFEKTGSYRGLYHVLHGTLSPLDGVGPEELGIPKLLQRVKDNGVREIILGLNPNVKGETTAIYIAREMKALGVRVSRLATGISASTGLEFVDSNTLSHALNDRKLVD